MDVLEPVKPALDERATYRAVFGVPEYRVLFGAQLVSMVGTMVADVALTVLILQRTGSPALAALTFTVSFVPYLFGGALLGALVDRWPARRTLASCDLISAGGFIVMALPGIPIAGLLGLTFVAGLVAPVFGGSRAALLPRLLGSGASYVLGRATISTAAQVAQVAGFALGGILLTVLSPRGALLIDAGSFLVSAVLLRLGLGSHPAGAASGTSLLQDSLRGLQSVLAHRPTRRLLLLRWLVPTCMLAPEALAAAYVQALHGSKGLTGWYLAMVPAATVVSDLAVGRFAGLRRQGQIMVPAALLTCAPLLLFALRPELPLAMAILLVIGLGSCYGLGLDARLLRTAPSHLRSRALSVDQAGLMFLQGMGFAVWGALGQLLGLGVAIALAGGCGVLVVLHWAWRDGRERAARS